jgi:DNA-binding GntR family transcriptional regulator
MIGKMVMANYGNSKHWIIEDVLFDVTVNSPYTTQGTSTSLAEYYEKSYGIHIRNARQPILKSSLSKRRDDNNGVAYLIPELLLMSGLPDDFDERRRR